MKRDIEKLKKGFQEVLVDSVETDEAQDVLPLKEQYKLFYLIVFILENIITSSAKSFNEFLENITDGLDEEQEDELMFLLERVLTYLKVPKGMIESLTDEDEEISANEFETLKDLVIEAIGDGDIFEFVTYALHNEDLPKMDDVDLDDVEFDWAFYRKKRDCEDANTKGYHKKCFKGYSVKDGGKGYKVVQGYWLYPKDFENKKKKTVSAKYHKSNKNKARGNVTGRRHWKPHSSLSISVARSKKNKTKSVGV